MPAGHADLSASLSFVSPTRGYLLLGATSKAVSDGPWTLYGTSDGGETWSRVAALGLTGVAAFTAQSPGPSLSFVTASDGLLVEGWWPARVTHDGGLHWSAAALPGSVTGVISVALSGRRVILLGALGNGAEDAVFTSDDGARSWSQATSGAPYASSSWVFVDGATWLRFHEDPPAGTWRLAITHNAGADWIDTSVQGLGDFHVVEGSFADPLEGWAMLTANSHCPPGYSCPASLPGPLAATKDGGLTWQVAANSR